MYPVSDRFPKRLTEDHTPVTQVSLFLTTGQVIDLPHTGGSVTVDGAQAIRRTCTVTCPDPTLIPRTPADELATYGARMRIARGVDYGDGTQELIPLGVFRLDDVDGDVSEGSVTLTGSDLAIIVQDDKFTAPYRVTGTVVSAITEIIQRSIPGADIISQITNTVIGSRVFAVEADPWAGVQEIAAAAGAECYASPDGEFIIATLPDLATTEPVWAIEAVEGGAYISGQRAMSSKAVHNGVLARGENTSDNAPPVSYLATDNDPNSPTYWGGPFGRRPTFHNSSTLITTGACQAAATVILAKAKAPNASGDISSLPNPALEPGDVLRVQHEDGSRELHQVAAFTVPLDLGGDFPISTISAKEDA
ncbi:DUF5047 domain-containing protein [Streptomyces sp. AC555_RSS877]|uniref:DUF5047 domain-containing protein n=1 Tax=Streptomyces sp. AC555_RSS877 TaxID=2823688 RepID=UPI001C27624E|nr:DUF5047 domain-containing protein [Streptomyces sp. AC555_RSS877]